ncbi:MAG: molybdopterin-dependent oxidoreductase, partial [SAR202 cluster bacterium]|nr:molybdopterin-dependent oxidoreductase [SAR202 cluster bacterium]
YEIMGDCLGARTAYAKALELDPDEAVRTNAIASLVDLPNCATPTVADTDTIGYTSSTGGSGVAFKTGMAAYEAAHDVVRQIVGRAALVWDVPDEQLEYADGALRHKSDPELRLSFKEIAGMLDETGGPVTGRATLNPTGHGGSYSADIVDVEVDPETGKVQILRLTAFQDAGTAVHPAYVEGQIQGGTVQGIGWAL